MEDVVKKGGRCASERVRGVRLTGDSAAALCKLSVV